MNMNQKVSRNFRDILKPIPASCWKMLLHTISRYKSPQSETSFLSFNMFQPSKKIAKARKSCEKLLLTTCRTKSWYSLVNSASWIKGDWSLGRWFGKWWWRFCKIVAVVAGVAGSLDWTTGSGLPGSPEAILAPVVQCDLQNWRTRGRREPALRWMACEERHGSAWLRTRQLFMPTTSNNQTRPVLSMLPTCFVSAQGTNETYQKHIRKAERCHGWSPVPGPRWKNGGQLNCILGRQNRSKQAQCRNKPA